MAITGASLPPGPGDPMQSAHVESGIGVPNSPGLAQDSAVPHAAPNEVMPMDAGASQGPDPGLPLPGDPAAQVIPRGLVEVRESAAPELLALDVSLLRQAAKSEGQDPVPIRDGEVLHDGRGDPTQGDQFKLVFRANRSCYVYVLAMDGSGWMQGIFPNSQPSAATPVASHREYMIPDGEVWFGLDRVRGVETIYIVASPDPRPDLEESVARLAAHQRPAQPRPDELSQVEEAPVIPNGFGSTREGGGVRLRSSQGGAVHAGSTTYVATSAGESIRITRWFKHE